MADNIQVKEGTSPIWLCSECRYTPLSDGGSTCANCEKGLPRPDLSFIKEMSRTGKSLRQMLQDQPDGLPTHEGVTI